MPEVHGYAAQSATSPLLPFSFFRREIRQNDLRIDVLFSGVCHSDIHTAHGDWDGSIYPHGTVYPCVPGHEIVGRVIEIGSRRLSEHAGDVHIFELGESRLPLLFYREVLDVALNGFELVESRCGL
ncbi:alcohol dehydrogenase catalytic domain-containing protein [Tunturiibacter lichenicola]|uniref:alcohol dehydrogenase catalytic domain-containing protein n=1 Tax=Tunturiibacter lichenicola TaxID=2051959 RepID=UPI0028C43AF8|nr:alcohol dehydrogenase catalytic domain-containing protein [Edaphobacter lichenicola]